jgi:2-methylcitrate dehydratase
MDEKHDGHHPVDGEDGDVVVRPRRQALGRRDLMKIGAGVVATALTASTSSAQGRGRGAAPQDVPDENWPPDVRSRVGYHYDANRESNNGPMDDTSARIVKFVHDFNASKLSDADVAMLNRITLDAMAALVAGFEEPSVRLCARLARQVSPNELKTTVMGYGITTSPELSAFANSAMLRHCDFNDLGPGGHVSDLIPAALSIGEAMHSSGLDVLAAIAIGYELRAVPGTGGEAACAGMTAAKLMNLSEDRLANALTCALTPHVTLNKGVGAMSMWKGLRSAEPVKNGVWGALMGREGITGPPQPFEGRGGLWSRNGRGEDFTLPADPGGKLALHRMGFKRYPSEGSSQATLDNVPDMRAWTKPEEIESIHHFMGAWAEIGDPPKWDPRNRETADHSMPYMLCRALMDGEIYLDSYTEAKYRDPAVLALMARMSVSPGVGFRGNAPARTIIRKKNGEERVFETQGGRKVAPEGELLSKPSADHRLTMDEIVAKFNRACEYKKVATAQRDRARAVWSNLRSVKDIGEAIQSLAKFGQPQAL